ncbi:MAG: RNA polymerase sigma-70 factor (family 1) [Lentisphaeria bacterium]|jgi:RNA polymerase sigma-70 factor (family 1)
MTQGHLLKSIYEKYQTDLLRFIASKFGNRHDAEDIVQDAFHNILTSEKAKTLENPRAYLYKAANNLALNRIRKEQRHSDYREELCDEPEFASPEQSISAQKDLESIERALGTLPKKYSHTFILSRVHLKSYLEISQELGIAVSTVEKHIIKVLQFLRDHLDEEGVL